MSTEFGEKLQSAILEKANDVDSYTWKLPKTRDDSGVVKQQEIKLIDVDNEDLQSYYLHCQSMLFSKNREHPGRVTLFKDIQSQRQRCGVELFLRYSESVGTSRIAVLDSIKEAIKNNNVSQDDLKHMVLYDLVNTSVEYRSLPIEMVMEGCLDKLGKFDRRHITLSFILKQGLWFSKEDLKDLTEKDSEGKEKNKEIIVKERLGLPSSIPILFTPTGLSYTQFRAIITLKSKKYSEMTTDQLKILRGRILYALEDSVKKHAEFWMSKEKEIEKVAKVKEITLRK